jgi:23S rRNA pseudouridine955/2504/2580 synthase
MTASTEPRSFTVTDEDDGIRLDRWFKRHLADVSFNQVSRWARTGQIRIDGKRATPGDRIEAGQSIRVPPAEARDDEELRPKRPLVELDDEEADYVRSMEIDRGRDWFLLNKPPGLATQGGTKTSQHLDRLLGGLAGENEQRPKLVHRLDKDTSGVILVARSARAASHFSKAFSGRTARKIYWAIITGVPSLEEGLIDAPLGKQPGSGGEKMQVDEENGQAAKTRYRMIDRVGNRAAWVELQPLTGRTHQLRAHMAAIGHPIVGDAKYGGAEAFLTGGVSRKMHLHARRLRIEGPDGVMIDGSAELPDHFADTLKMLGFDPLAGDALPMDTFDYKTDPVVKARREAAAAKSRRRERKGERRGRGLRAEAGKPAGKPSPKPSGRGTRAEAEKPAGKTPTKPSGRDSRGGAGKPAGKPPTRPGGRGPARPGGPPARKPSGKPPAKR